MENENSKPLKSSNESLSKIDDLAKNVLNEFPNILNKIMNGESADNDLISFNQVCKFWDDDEFHFIIAKKYFKGSNLVCFGKETAHVFKNALPITQQEVINLLFTK